MMYVHTHSTYTSNGCCVTAKSSNVCLPSISQVVIWKTPHISKKLLFESTLHWRVSIIGTCKFK